MRGRDGICFTSPISAKMAANRGLIGKRGGRIRSMPQRGTLAEPLGRVPSLRRSCFMAAAVALLFTAGPLLVTASFARGPDSVADVAEGLQDAVVNISTTQTLNGSAA